MNVWGAILFGLFLSAGSLSLTSGWAKKELALLQDETLSPVSRVAKLLEDMLKQLDADADEDAKVDESMMCWCKNGEQEKTKAIEDGTDKSAQLTNAIEQDRALAAKLTTELDNLKAELDKNNKALATAIALRKKEAAEFNAAEASTATTIEQLKGATDALQKGLPKAMVQGEVVLGADSPVTQGLLHAFHAMKQRKDNMQWSMHTERERELMQNILMHDRDIGLLQSGRVEAITSPLDVIHGTIQQLHEEFQKNLDSLQSNENDAQAAHDAAKSEKEEQIEAGTDMINKKTQDLADAEERAASARVDLDDTQNVLKADTEYLASLKEQCKLHADEYAARMADRQEETMACHKALEIVSSDENRNKFAKTFGLKDQADKKKLGSRRLKEFKEERETQSMRSQTNAARRSQWGTDDRYLLLQIGSTMQNERAFGTHLPQAKKLADIAARTQAFWKAKVYEADQANASKTALSNIKSHLHKSDKPAKAKLGLTAEQTLAKGRKDAMKIVKNGVEKMKSELELQQGEETARKDWCVDEIHAVEKKIDINHRLIMDLEEHIERIEYMLKEGKLELKNLIHDLEDAQIEVQKGSNDRRKQGTLFQKTVMEQKEAKMLLEGTLSVLRQFYDRKKKASLLRTAASSDATKLSVVASEVKNVATTMLEGGDTSLSFRNARNSEMDGVIANGDAGLQARAKELAKAAKQPKAALVKEKAVVKEDDFKVNTDAVADFMDAWHKIPFRKSASLLQGEHQAIKPAASVEKLLKEAQGNHADAQKIIAQAQAIVGKRAPKAMLQQSQPAGAPPPPGFKKKQDSAMAGGITVMLNNLIDDTDAMIKEAVKDEAASLTAYEVFMKESNELLTEMKDHITSLQMEIAKAEQEKELKEQELKDAEAEEKRLRQLDIDIHGVEGCKYLLENYDVRKEERKEEIDSLDESITVIGAGGGDPKVEAIMDPKADKVPDVAEGNDLPELTEPEDEEEVEDAPGQPPSEHHVVPEGVEIIGPNGETAISKIMGR